MYQIYKESTLADDIQVHKHTLNCIFIALVSTRSYTCLCLHTFGVITTVFTSRLKAINTLELSLNRNRNGAPISWKIVGKDMV